MYVDGILRELKVKKEIKVPMATKELKDRWYIEQMDYYHLLLSILYSLFVFSSLVSLSLLPFITG